MRLREYSLGGTVNGALVCRHTIYIYQKSLFLLIIINFKFFVFTHVPAKTW